MVKAVAYIRVSTEEQASDGHASLVAQTARIKAFADRFKIDVVAWYCDAGVSAYHDDKQRAQFHAAVEHAKADADISLFFVTEPSRFFRNRFKAAQYKQELLLAGVQVRPVDLDVDPASIEGQWVDAIMDTLAHTESMRIAAHTFKAMAQNLQMRDPETGWCYQNGGQPLFGYTSLLREVGKDRRGHDRNKPVWILDEQQLAGRPAWEWARELLHRRLEGASYDVLRDWLVESGVPPIRGRYWSTSTICYLFRKPKLMKYAGFAVWNTTGPHGRSKPEEEWVTVPNASPALITQQELEALLAMNSDRKRNFTRRTNDPSRVPAPLAGYFRCAHCGGNMVLYYSHGYQYYVCSSRKYGKQPCVPSAWLPREELEQQVLEFLQAKYGRTGSLGKFVADLREEMKHSGRLARKSIDEFEVQIEKLEQECRNLAAGLSEDMADVTAFLQKEIGTRKQQQRDLQEKIKRLTEDPTCGIRATARAVESMAKAMAQLEKDPTDRALMRKLFKTFIERAEWDPETERMTLYVVQRAIASAQPVVGPAGFEPATKRL